jgi:hypothetical protein
MLDRFGGSAMITITLLSLLTVVIIAWWLLARRRARVVRARHDEIPLFAVPASQPSQVPRPWTGGARTERRRPTASGVAVHTPASSPAVADSTSRISTPAPTIRTRDGAVSTLARRSRSESPTANALANDAFDEMGEAVDGASVRFWRIADGTLQFLPGRLEIAAGRDAGQEIRFVRTAGPDGTVVTFGRAEGAPYRHVQLREPTVSRVHARMALERGPAEHGGSHPVGDGDTAQRWRIENLSATNPVVVNGRALATAAGPSASVVLSDGDRIEMGEVAFVFHAR